LVFSSLLRWVIAYNLIINNANGVKQMFTKLDLIIITNETMEAIRDTDFFLDFANSDGIQALFTPEQHEDGAAYEEAAEIIKYGRLNEDEKSDLLAQLNA
jgi:hypothetical protein